MELNEKRAERESPAGLYVLYGEETYLVEQTARRIARQTVDEAADVFDFQAFDGQTVTLEQLEEAVEALPMMAERKCVSVRDFDPGSADEKRLTALLTDLPESCVLVFWQITVQPDRKKAWQSFLKLAESVGTVTRFDRKSPDEVVRLLVGGAKRRGCVLAPADARALLDQAGNDLQLLLNELEKLTALADGGTITRAMIDAAATKNLETRVFDLSKAILAGNAARAYDLLHHLFIQREEPLAILGVLSTAYADLYRAKVAVTSGERAEALASDFKSYKGKEFRLRNAARDAARMDLSVLRDCLAILAKTDTALKSGSGDGRILLEETVARLVERAGRR